ncbi:hypothetical protein IWQ61_000809 [Dispira simplex]|nr:hypothetical protein IWQ61_000809 [Dispira simplex]
MYQHSVLLFRIGDPLLLTTDTVYRLFQPVITASDEALTVVLDSPSFSNNVVNSTLDTLLGWDAMQRFLALLYSVASQCAAEGNKYLFQTDILLTPPKHLETCAWLRSVNAIFLLESEHKEWTSWLHGLHLVHSTISVVHIPSPPLDYSTGTSLASEVNSQNSVAAFDVTAIGGTFDHLHSGHKLLLTMAMWITRKTLHCGITGPSMLSTKKYAQYMQSLQQRTTRVWTFLNKLNPDRQYKVWQLNDPFGPTITEKEIGALVCSEETLAGGRAAIRKYYALREQSDSPLTQTDH